MRGDQRRWLAPPVVAPAWTELALAIQLAMERLTAAGVPIMSAGPLLRVLVPQDWGGPNAVTYPDVEAGPQPAVATLLSVPVVRTPDVLAPMLVIPLEMTSPPDTIAVRRPGAVTG